ncbi:MAG: hypothetical protein SGILL_010813, partial [Bacillariaceae sp.]
MIPSMFLFMLAAASWLLPSTTVQAQRFDCDPCIDRSSFTIQAIVHGPSEETFWQEMKAAMEQAGKDMGVNFVMDLYDTFDSATMATDIRAAATSPSPPDALIVTIPTQEVQDAVQETKDSLPIFGFNSAPSDEELLESLKGFVHMDETRGGQVVGEYFFDKVQDVRNPRGLFINHAPENESLQNRYNGIVAATDGEIQWETIEDFTEESLAEELGRCRYSVIQLAGFVSMNATLSALDMNDCDETEYMIGTFDVDTEVYDLIESDVVELAVSQQQHLQGSMVVVMASIFATTGQNLDEPSDSIAYLSGPYLVTASNLPSAELQLCSGDGFPVCPNTMTPLGDEATCACTDRKEIKIVAVTHATTTDIFWDPTTRFDPEASDADVIEEQIITIQAACEEDIDGLIVSFPSSEVVDAVTACTDKGIPVIDINAGPTLAGMAGYQYVGQNDFRGGFEAGQRLIEAGV